MPGTLLRDDWQKSVTDELANHARNLGQAFQVIGDTPQPPPAPAGPDPQQVLAELQQHAQNVSSTVQQAPSGIVQFGQQQAGQVQQELQDFASGLVKFNQAQPPTSAPGSQPLAEGVQPTPAATAPGGGTLQDYARQQAEKFGLDPDVFTRQIQQESGFNPTAKSPAGATGIAQFMPATAQGMGVDPNDPYASLEGAARLMSNYLKQYQGDYGKALAAYNAGPGNVAKYGGVPPFEETQRYVKTILSARDTAPYQPNVQESLERVGQGIAPRDISQFGDRQLTNSEAYAACGPAAAVRFAQRFGRNPSLREAVDLSKELGWTEGQGMAGLQSEKALMDRLGVATKVVVGPAWDAFAKEAHSGNPVTISTGAHYFFADSFDPGSGAFHVGRSGTDLVGGKEWMTRGEIESAAQRLGGGQVQGALFADNPTVPSKSAAGSTPNGSGVAPVVARAQQPQPLQIIGDAAERGRQAVSQVVGDLQIASSGESRALTPAMQPTPSDALTNPTVQQSPATPPLTPSNLPPAQETLGQAGQNALGLAGDVAAGKYSGLNVLGDAEHRPTMEEFVQAGPLIGGMAGIAGPAASTRMYHGTAAEFERPTLGTFNEDSLFGPGYYVTSDPRVAGGIVSEGKTMPASVVGGIVHTTPESLQQTITARIDRLKQMQAANPLDPKLGPLNDSISQMNADLQRMLEARQPGRVVSTGYAQARGAEGANVRSVDLPQNLRLFDAEAPLSPQDAQAIGRRLWGTDPEAQAEIASWSTRDVDGSAVYDLIRGEVGSKAEANKVLADAGFDGITYSGGNRIPMPDATGLPIEHQATVVFPESLDKIRNAISGRQGGQANVGYAAALGGTAALGAGALTAREMGFTAPDTSLTAAMQPTPSDRLTSPTLRTGEAAQPPPSMPPPLAGPAILPSLGEARDAIVAGDNQAALDALSRAGEAASTTGVAQALGEQRLVPLREEIANAPVLGGTLGMLRGPELLSDEELLQQASPEQIASARSLIERGNQIVANKRGEAPEPVTDTDIASFLRSTRVAEAVAMTHGPGRPIDYDALARLRDRARQVPMPGVPAAEASAADKALSFTVNNVLSNPASLLANAAGGVMETVKRPLVTAATGDLGGAGADLRAMGLAAGDALGNAALTFRTGQRLSRAADQPEAFQGAAGMLATPFLRVMGATDELAYGLNSAGAQASKLVQLMRANPKLSQAEVMDTFQKEILAAGQQGAKEAVFQTGGTGIGEKLAAARRGFTAPDATVGERIGGAAANVVVPFSSVPDVLLTRGAKRIPGVNELITAPIEVVKALRHNDPVAAKRAATSAALATMTNLAIWTQVQEGTITGSGPDDPAKKRALMNARDERGNPIWRPNSIKVGDQWVPYSSLGGVAVQIGAIANAVEQYEAAGKKVNPDMAFAVGKALGDTITDAWYLQTLSGVFSAIGNGTVPEWMGSQALSTAGRAIPEAALLNTLKKLTDPVARQAEPKPADPRTWAEYFAARVPGLSQTVKPKLDPATGRPIEEPQTVASALTRGTAPGEPSPVNEELARHNLGAPDPPTSITTRGGASITLTEPEQRRFLELAGPEIEQLVLEVSRDPDYQQASPDIQRTVLQKMITAGRRVATATMFESLPEDELLRRIEQSREAERRQAEPAVRLP